jgi:uncharacterized protein
LTTKKPLKSTTTAATATTTTRTTRALATTEIPARTAPVTITGVLLYPGAGTDAQHPALVALEHALRSEFVDLVVNRVDFPYRREGRRMPDRAPQLVASVHEEVATFAQSLGVPTAQLVIGGRSMGGRMCSMAIAEGLAVAGLVCMSYPLHPPKKPEKLRVEHLPKVRVPSLFISGSRDAFGTPQELDTHIGTVPGPVELVILEGKGHDLALADETIARHLIRWLKRLKD